jgi:hypothetical protein
MIPQVREFPGSFHETLRHVPPFEVKKSLRKRQRSLELENRLGTA